MEQKTHWLKNPNKNYLGHWDLPENDLILTIKKAGWEDVTDPTTGKTESKRVVHFVENYKPLICNQTNAASIYRSTGIRYLEDSAGAKIKLFIGEDFDRRNRIKVECVRIRDEKIKQRPAMNPNYPGWKKAKEALKKGAVTIEQLRENYLLTPENEKLICLR